MSEAIAVEVESPAVEVESPAVEVEAPAVEVEAPAVEVEAPKTPKASKPAPKTSKPVPEGVFRVPLSALIVEADEGATGFNVRNEQPVPPAFLEMMKPGWSRDYPALVEPRGAKWLVKDGHTRRRAAIALDLGHAWVKVQSAPVEGDAWHVQQASNMRMESDPVTQAEIYFRGLMVEVVSAEGEVGYQTEEEVAQACGHTLASVRLHLKFHAFLQSLDDPTKEGKSKRRLTFEEAVRSGKVGIRALLDTAGSSEDERDAALDGMLFRIDKGLAPKPRKAKVKAESTTIGQTREQARAFLDSLESVRLKGPHGDAVLYAVRAAYEVMVGVRKADDLLGVMDALAKGKGVPAPE